MLQGRFYLDFRRFWADLGPICDKFFMYLGAFAACSLCASWLAFWLSSGLLLACFLPASYFFLACFLHASCLHPARLLLASCLLFACFFFAVLLLSCLLLACFLLACCLIPACIMLTSGLLPASFLLDSCSYQAQTTATNSTRFPFLALQVVSSK